MKDPSSYCLNSSSAFLLFSESVSWDWATGEFSGHREKKINCQCYKEEMVNRSTLPAKDSILGIFSILLFKSCKNLGAFQIYLQLHLSGVPTINKP